MLKRIIFLLINMFLFTNCLAEKNLIVVPIGFLEAFNQIDSVGTQGYKESQGREKYYWVVGK